MQLLYDSRKHWGRGIYCLVISFVYTQTLSESGSNKSVILIAIQMIIFLS